MNVEKIADKIERRFERVKELNPSMTKGGIKLYNGEQPVIGYDYSLVEHDVIEERLNLPGMDDLLNIARIICEETGGTANHLASSIEFRWPKHLDVNGEIYRLFVIYADCGQIIMAPNASPEVNMYLQRQTSLIMACLNKYQAVATGGANPKCRTALTRIQ